MVSIHTAIKHGLKRDYLSFPEITAQAIHKAALRRR